MVDDLNKREVRALAAIDRSGRAGLADMPDGVGERTLLRLARRGLLVRGGSPERPHWSMSDRGRKVLADAG